MVPADHAPAAAPDCSILFLGLDNIWELDVSRMWVWKAKGRRSLKCFIQVCFKFLLQHRTGAPVVGTIQISSVKQERRPCSVRCGSQGSLLDLPGAVRTQVLGVFCFWESQALTCPPCGVHPLPAVHCEFHHSTESAGSSSETCQCFTGSPEKPILEHFLKEIISALIIRAKDFLANSHTFD